MLEYALYLASAGFAVFPCEPNSKKPATAHGCKDASRDPAQIRAWWTASPSANIAIATGAASNLLVLDADGANGLLALSELPLVPTLRVKTPGKIDKATGRHAGVGFHLYYQAVPGVTVGVGGKNGLPPHIDHRGEGGYVMAPPSVHPDGTGVYEWLEPLPIAPCPPELAARFAKKAPRSERGAPPDLDSIPVGKDSISLDAHLHAIATAPNGQKHDIFRNACCAFACAAREAGEPEDRATARLTKLLLGQLAVNHGHVEDWSLAESTLMGGLRRAYDKPETDVLTNRDREFNDDGFGRRFAKDFAERARYVDGQGWRTWDGASWNELPNGTSPTDLMSDLIFSLQQEVEEDEDLVKFLKSKKTAGGYAAMLKLAQRHALAAAHEWDRDPFLLGTPSATLDLRSGESMPPTAAHHLTVLAGARHDPAAACPRFQYALLQMQGGDQSAVEWLRLYLGSCLIGEAVDGFVIFYGSGFDGKSTVCEILHGVLGAHARACSPSAILANRAGTAPHTSLIGGLRGARLAIVDELPSDSQLAMGTIKAMFGRTPIRVQTGMGKDFVDVVLMAKLLIATNHLPRLDERDFGTLRRTIIVPFDGNLRAQNVQRDDTFGRRLVAEEGPGILNWLLSGCRDWLAAGRRLPPCARIAQATEEFIRDDDLVGRFLTAAVEKREDYSVGVDELFRAYEIYTDETADQRVSKRAFSNRLRERGHGPTGPERRCHGLRLVQRSAQATVRR